MAQEKVKGGELKDGKIRKDDRVTVYGTGYSKHIRRGASIDVHPVHAQTLINSGKATSTAPKGK
jgi:hypothetical protein